MKIKFIVALIFFGCYPFMMQSQVQVNGVFGKVVDKVGKGISYVNVILYSLPDSIQVCGVSTKTDGNFLIKTKNQKSSFIEITRMGYKKKDINVVGNDMGIIQLEQDVNVLNDVTVTNNKETMKLQNGKLVIDVANSALSKENNPLDVLRKLPGMIMKNDDLVTITGGKPEFYINGRKVHSINEVKQLEVKNIKEVTINNSPGAEYGADVSTVIEIKTFKRDKGLSLQLDGNIDRCHKWSYGEAIKTDYNTGTLDLFGTLGYNKYRRKTNQPSKDIISTNDTIWNDSTNMKTIYNINYYTWSAGTNYDISDKQSIGIMYDGYLVARTDGAPYTSDILENGAPYVDIKGASLLRNTERQHHINTYYTGKFGKLALNIYGDYANSYMHRNQTVSESSSRYGQTNTDISNTSNYNVYAINPKATYSFNDKHQLKFGIDLSLVRGNNNLAYSNNYVPNSKSKTNEGKTAEYISYSFNNKAFSFDAGLRYEYVKYKYDDLVESKNDINKTYHNLFPDLEFTYKNKAISQSLSYRVSTTRPMFDQLNNMSYYTNRFSYLVGNPTLIPQISHQFKYSFVYGFIYYSLEYDYIKDCINNYFTNSNGVLISTWKNYPKVQQVVSTLSLQHKFKFFEPIFNLTFDKNFQSIEYLNKKINATRPCIFVDSNNNFYLPDDFIIDAEYQYTGKGNSSFFTFYPYSALNISVSKSFMKGNMNISLQANDIFRKNIYTCDGGIGNVYFWQKDDEDSRTLSLHLTWRFNDYKKKYKGESAATDEINRL